MFDAAIVGAGPAGISAVLNLALHEKSVIWFGSRGLSAKVGKSEKIANYPGMPMIGGETLNSAFLSQIDEMELELVDRMVTNITRVNGSYLLLGGNEVYEARTLLLAVGATSSARFMGEERLLGRGVSYCATCDGFLYRGKTIAVYCGDRRYEHEVTYLAEMADKVYLFAPYKDCLTDASSVSDALSVSDASSVSSKIIRRSESVREICGESRVQSLNLSNDLSLSVDGIFILRNSLAPTVLMKGLAMDGAHIAVDRGMATNLEGCYAAGDVTGRPYQIAKAVGEGNVAAHSMLAYLSEKDRH